MPELERLVLARVDSDFINATSYAAAAADAGALTEVVLDVSGFARVDITLEVTTTGNMSNAFIAVRSTSKAQPDLGTDSDWSRMNRIANVDTSSGVDTSVPLVECIPIASVGRHTITLPVTNRFVSAVVWADGTGGRGNVYMYRGS